MVSILFYQDTFVLQIGVPDFVRFLYLAREAITTPFIENSDLFVPRLFDEYVCIDDNVPVSVGSNQHIGFWRLP